jgi:hypothetical protein
MSTPESRTTPPSAVEEPTQTLRDATPSGASSGSVKSPGRRLLRTYAIIIVVIVVVMVLAAYVITGGFHGNNTSRVSTLIASDTEDSIPGGQFDAVSFVTSSSAIVNGTVYNTFGITLYTMTPNQYLNYSKTLNPSGHEWTSGRIKNDTVYSIDVTVQPGDWDFVFSDPWETNATAIGFYTALTLTPN